MAAGLHTALRLQSDGVSGEEFDLRILRSGLGHDGFGDVPGFGLSRYGVVDGFCINCRGKKDCHC